MSLDNLKILKEEIAPYKLEIINHPLYKSIKNIEDLKIFMEYHIYAVWDFMSLLKSLQINLTCIEVPWFPVGDADTRYLINEIVTGEESDIDHLGNRKSHYELYLEAMAQSGANTSSMYRLAELLQKKIPLDEALETSMVPNAANLFLKNTFNIINSNEIYIQSAVFTFSREDLIPAMFISIVKDLDNQFPDNVSILKYYLERHIEVDGDHHSNLALEMTNKLCGTNRDRWKKATLAVKEALSARVKLWDSAMEAILTRT